jgi:hypothetical protein
MNWAEFALIAIIVVAIIVLAYLNFENFNHFMENYFIFIIIIIFIILIITLNFNNSTAITTYMKVTKPFAAPLIYQVPTQADSAVSSIITVSFSGLYDNTQVALAAGTSGVYYFNYGAMNVGDSGDIPNYVVGAAPIFKLTKTADDRLQVEINDVLADKPLDGYLTLALLATGNQDVNGGFERIQ